MTKTDAEKLARQIVKDAPQYTIRGVVTVGAQATCGAVTPC
jgi:hypothetical protein